MQAAGFPYTPVASQWMKRRYFKNYWNALFLWEIIISKCAICNNKSFDAVFNRCRIDCKPKYTWTNVVKERMRVQKWQWSYIELRSCRRDVAAYWPRLELCTRFFRRIDQSGQTTQLIMNVVIYRCRKLQGSNISS